MDLLCSGQEGQCTAKIRGEESPTARESAGEGRQVAIGIDWVVRKKCSGYLTSRSETRTGLNGTHRGCPGSALQAECDETLSLQDPTSC